MSRNWADALVDFVDDGTTKTSKRTRLFASFYGSFLFHFALIVAVPVRLSIQPSETLILVSLPLFFILSLLFGLIISTGTKGGLIRRFWYGVTLPAICYYLAFSIVSLVQNMGDSS